ncbi:hypothetical protein [Tropicimonas aquimaris]|uniref:HTH cro/C1-type domain-containing protein n=1 Tax=Tropicimonas aquimaris TaxID=914152 RepID=A0ABW3IR62_9RHOB
MENWKKKSGTARLNIFRLAHAGRMRIEVIARDAALAMEELERFLDGEDTLTYGQVLRLCEALEAPIWALQFREMNAGLDIAEFKVLERKVAALAASERVPEAWLHLASPGFGQAKGSAPESHSRE